MLVLRVTALRSAPLGTPVPNARAYLVDSSATPAASDAYQGWPTLPRRVAPRTTYIADTAGVIRVPDLAAGQRALVVSALGRMPAIIRVQVRPAAADTVAVALDIIGCECP